VTQSSDSFSISTKNVPCGEAGIVCTKAVHITVSSVRIRLVLGAPPTLNDVALSSGRTNFSGGEIEVNDMFHYVRLDTGVEILYDRGTDGVIYQLISQVVATKEKEIDGNDKQWFGQTQL